MRNLEQDLQITFIFLGKAEHCRRPAARFFKDDDRTRLSLLALADEFEAKAKASMAETVEELSLDNGAASGVNDDGPAA